MATHPLLQKLISKGIDADEIAELGNIFFLQGREHSSPSPETLRRLEALDKQMNEVEVFHAEQRAFMDDMRKMMEDMQPIIDNYKAASTAALWATKIVGFVAIVLGAFLTYKNLH